MRGLAEAPPFSTNLVIDGLNHFSSAFRESAERLGTHVFEAFMGELRRRAMGHGADMAPEGGAQRRAGVGRDAEVAATRAHMALRSITQRRAGACRKALLEALDPEVRRVMHVTLAGDVSLMSRMTGADRGRHHPEWARRRAEAMKVFDQYPAFTPLLRDQRSALLAEIDGYGDFRRGISEQTGLTVRQVEALRGKSVHALINVQGSRVGERGVGHARKSNGFGPYRHYPPRSSAAAILVSFTGYGGPAAVRTITSSILGRSSAS